MNDTKPGYKTTEFWLSLAAMLIGALLASGILDPADPTSAKVLQLVGMISSMLTALGYGVTRTMAKKDAAKLEAIRMETTKPGGA